MKNKIDNIEILQGDLTSMNLDIIVNAANHTLLGGGGIDGIIHYKAGTALLEECRKLNGCEIGSAKMTDGYNLQCKKIIHACGPFYYGNREKAPEQLKNCYIKSLELAENYRKENNFDNLTIGFPCISTGIYGYPKDEACKIAIDTVREYSNINLEVKFVCYEELDYKLYMNYFNDVEKKFLNYKIKLQFESEMILWQCGMLGEVVKDVVMAVYIAIFIKGTSKEMLIRMK